LLPIKATSLLHTFYLRRGSTDAAAVLFTLVRQAYGRYLPQREVKYMLDLGANVGCTTVWFLSRFPKAKLIAVEPDPSNFEILKKNCAPYGDRALLLQAAVWPRQARLSMTANEALDAVQVFESPDGDCLGMPISAILERFGFPQLDILISNIEGAERDMFSIDADAWIERTQFMAVSTHGPDCLRAVLEATDRHGFKYRKYRDLRLLERATA
jgi:FkbM family methyltransferase